MQMLIADDDPMYRKLFETFARKLGHDPVVACDGEEAWEKFQQLRPRLVLSDWMMPRLSGVDLCKRIREEKHPRRPYILLVTSLAAEENVLEGFAAGADDYVAKPFEHRIFASRVGAACEAIANMVSLEEQLHRQVVAKFQNALGHESPELMESLGALTSLYVEKGIYAKARAFLRRQIDIVKAQGDLEALRRLKQSLQEVNDAELAASAPPPAEKAGRR